MVRIGGFGASRMMRIAMSLRFSALSSARKITPRLAGKRFDVGRVGEASSPNVAPDNFLQILFEERNVALGHFDHAGAVGMATRNRSAEIRQAG